MKMIYLFLSDLFKSKAIVLELAKRDFKSRYLGSHLGILWAFIHPSAYIAILWFVFQIGFKSAPVSNFPFLLWLMSGLIPWFFFSESLMNATNAVIENSYLVKKVVFRIGMLPIIKVLSSLFVHLLFIGLLFLIYFIYGYKPDIFFIQVFYYLFAVIVLVLGISFITSALIIFIKDTGHAIAILLQFCLWLTPIFWSLKILPEKYHLIIKLNPVYYIIEGYRNSLIYKIWFWQQPFLTIYFWTVTIIILAFGAFFFHKVKPHFADVL
ncbi:MAG: ABC transporter permease [Phycisphaerae bacterium]|jgi:lipopolysaccharide transport system permease protein/teichoic acid transport system permease protein